MYQRRYGDSDGETEATAMSAAGLLPALRSYNGFEYKFVCPDVGLILLAFPWLYIYLHMYVQNVLHNIMVDEGITIV